MQRVVHRAEIQLRIVGVTTERDEHIPGEIVPGCLALGRATREVFGHWLSGGSTEATDAFFKCGGVIPERITRGRRVTIFHDHISATGRKL